MTIPLGPALLAGSSGLPGGFGRAVLSRVDRREPTARVASLFGLAPCGVWPAIDLAADAVRSYRTFSPLPLDSPLRGSLGAGPSPRATPNRSAAFTVSLGLP